MASVRAWSKRVSDLLEASLTAMALVAAIVFVISAVRYAFDRAEAPQQLMLGEKLPIDGIDWAQSRSTVLIATQADCPACDASRTFHEQLVEASSAGPYRVVVVAPHPPETTQTLLRSMRSRISDVRQEDLGRLGIPGTPAVIVVDNRGTVKNAWVGKLTRSMEDSVFTRLAVPRPPRASRVTPMPEVLTAIGAAQSAGLAVPVAVIDSRPRATFHEGHIQGSTSIPFDELETRVLHEVRRDTTIALYCEYAPSCAVVVATSESEGECEWARRLLHRVGFKNVHVLLESLDDLEASGIRVERPRI